MAQSPSLTARPTSLSGSSKAEAVAWRHIPWLAALVLAPLMLGSVRSEAQAILGLLVGLSLFLLAQEAGANQSRVLPAWLLWLTMVALVLPLIPFPQSWIAKLSPERALLAREFPIEPGISGNWVSLTIAPARTIKSRKPS